MTRSAIPAARAPLPATAILGFLGALTTLLVAQGVRAQTTCSEASPGRANLSGVVRATPGDVPLPGATVTARWRGGNRQMESGPDGRYAFCSLRADLSLVLSAELAPYRSADVGIELGGGREDVPLAVDLRAADAVKGRGRVTGRVLDRETLEPVAGARIGLDEGDFIGLSDAAGRFLIEDLIPGTGLLRIQHLAYGEHQTPLDIPGEGTLEVELLLAPAALPVDPITVTVLGMRSFKLDMAGFYERRDVNERLGLGHYLTRNDIQRRGASRVSHILSEIPRVAMLDGGCPTSRCNIPVIGSSGGDCGRLKDVGGEQVLGASLYIDGRRMSVVSGRRGHVMLSGVDDFLTPGDVAGIEVYTGAGDLPGEFADANAQRCGAIVIWTGS